MLNLRLRLGCRLILPRWLLSLLRWCLWKWWRALPLVTTCAMSPQKCFASWMSSHAAPILDTWKWARDGIGERTRYTGLARIPVDKIPSMLAASGCGGWFADAFRDTQAPASMIQWQEREGDECDLASLARCKRFSPSLDIVGHKQLGLRQHCQQGSVFHCFPEDLGAWASSCWMDSRGGRACSQTPFFWRRKGGRGLCDFSFWGTGAKETDLMPVSVETEAGLQTFWVKLAPSRAHAGKRHRRRS